MERARGKIKRLKGFIVIPRLAKSAWSSYHLSLGGEYGAVVYLTHVRSVLVFSSENESLRVASERREGQPRQPAHITCAWVLLHNSVLDAHYRSIGTVIIAS